MDVLPKQELRCTRAVIFIFLPMVRCVFVAASGASSKEQLFMKTQRNNIETNPFVQLVESGDPFVDKSLFIKDFLELEPNWHRARQLVIPPKFGRTMNLRMLEHFLSIQVDEEGRAINPNQTAAYRLFVLGQTASGRRMHFNIANHKDIIENYLAQYPVVYISFKDVKGSTRREVFTGFYRVALDVYRKYCFNSSLSEKMALLVKRNFRLNPEKSLFIAGCSEVEDIFTFLTHKICSHFGRRVYVLLDDHDEPFRSLLNTSLSQGDFDKVMRCMRNIVSDTLHTDSQNSCYKNKGDTVIMGALMMRDDGYQGYHFNERLSEHNILDNKCGRYFGFTVEETNALFDAHVPNKELRARAKEFYFGYRVGDIEFYNPYDIANFIRYGRVSDYWMQATALPQGFLNIKGVKDKVLSLLSGGVVYVNWNKREDYMDGRMFSVPDLQNLRAILRGITKDCWNSKLSFSFSRFLFSMGYFAKVQGSMDMTLANEEIVLGLTTRVLQQYGKEYNVPVDVREKVVAEFGRLTKSNETVLLKTSLEALLRYFSFKNGTDDEWNGAAQSYISMVSLMSKLAFPRGKLNIQFKKYCGYVKLLPTASLQLLDEQSNLGLIISVKNASSRTTDINGSCFGEQRKQLRVRHLNIQLFSNKSFELSDQWTMHLKNISEIDAK